MNAVKCEVKDCNGYVSYNEEKEFFHCNQCNTLYQ